MAHRYVVMASAWLEIIVGATFITAPDVLCVLLFDAKPDGIAMPLARWLGVGLLGLGIASLPSKDWESRRNAVGGLFVFNAGVAILVAWVGVVTAAHGYLLWPVAILHAVIVVALLPQLLASKGSLNAASSLQDAARGNELK
jgi:hypothetical protein